MYSMTGYGKGVASNGITTVTVEVKSVNHRYLDLGIKLPKSYLFLEEVIKKAISGGIARGHVDVFFELKLDNEGRFSVDTQLAGSYLSAAKQLKQSLKKDKCSVRDDVTLGYLLKLPDVITRQQPADDEESVKKLTAQAVEAALESLRHMRAREGAALKADIASKLTSIENSLNKIEQFAPLVVEAYRENLNARIAEVLEPNKIDAARLATEVALFADRCAIDEEITRLKSHIKGMRAMLEATEPVGRKMDFLVQEFNREANTIGSKANDIRITGEVLAIKNEIEKMREQAANIE